MDCFRLGSLSYGGQVASLAMTRFAVVRNCSLAAPRIQVNDYDALRDYLKRQKLPEFVLGFEQIEEIIDAALPRAAQRASWWETLRSPQEKMPQREACLAGGYIATRLADGKSVRFKRMK
jgi:hypothetical protein